MAGELTRWVVSTPAQRDRDREIAIVRKNTDIALARAAGVAEVGQAALLDTLGLALIKRSAAMCVPEDAEKFDLIATTATIGMAQQITRLAGQS